MVACLVGIAADDVLRECGPGWWWRATCERVRAAKSERVRAAKSERDSACARVCVRVCAVAAAAAAGAAAGAAAEQVGSRCQHQEAVHAMVMCGETRGHPHGHGHVPSTHGPMGLRVRRTGCGRRIEKQAYRRRAHREGRGLPEVPCIRPLRVGWHAGSTCRVCTQQRRQPQDWPVRKWRVRSHTLIVPASR